MKALISKSDIRGMVDAPSSKSYTIRALMCAALASGRSYLRRALSADDTLAAADVLQKIGSGIYKSTYGWRVVGRSFKAPSSELFCRDSAATFRFMLALASVVPGKCRLVPGAGLAKRPVQPMIDALTQLGVKCRLEGAVVTVEGGNLAGGTVHLPGDISSQFVSALLLVAPLAEQGLHIELTSPPISKPYLEMTLDCLKKFGIRVMAVPDLTEFRVASQDYRPTDYTVEGDWSQASYLLALGALSGETVVTNLNAESLQGDRIVLNLLQKMGARLSVRRSSVMVQKSRLRGIAADLKDAIDLLPTMAILAATAEGESQFSGVAGARIKESNRLDAIKQELEKMGIRVHEEEDKITIMGGRPRGTMIHSHGDHRLAMAFGVLGTATGDMTILEAESVSKTYPDFWKVLKELGGKAELNV